MKLLEGKVAVVTGAARGIGKAIALRFAEEGASVVFTDLKVDENFQNTEKELQALGVQAKGYASNAADFEDTAAVVAQIVKDFGRIDVLVNNAGITRDGLMMRMSEQQWDMVINVNLKSAFNFIPVSYTHLDVYKRQVLAILNEAVEGDEARAVMERTLADTTLTQTTIYFRYYLNQALKKAGLGDRLLDNMQVWEDQMALGLSTWAEQPEPSRSDCHAWGSSPNIEFFRTILGIDSDGPGFSRILIEPSLGKLKEVSGTMPHPRGDIAVKYLSLIHI